MSIQVQVTLRNKKLGVLIRDARLAARRNTRECAQAIGITSGVFRAYEEGRRAPSLPEMEVLACYLNIPIQHFWGRDAKSDDPWPAEPFDLLVLAGLRHRMIGALLRKERMKTSISLKVMAEQAGIPQSRLRAYEMGERPVPLSELEALIVMLGGQMDTFFDQSGPIGSWMNRQKAIQDFLQLPSGLQAFVCKPVNRPYLELAIKLSGLSSGKLRGVAEDLLDITF